MHEGWGHVHGQVEPRVILERYGVKRFVTQQLQEQAGKHAGMMAAFCERMGWRNLEMLIAAFQAGSLNSLMTTKNSQFQQHAIVVGYWVITS